MQGEITQAYICKNSNNSYRDSLDLEMIHRLWCVCKIQLAVIFHVTSLSFNSSLWFHIVQKTCHCRTLMLLCTQIYIYARPDMLPYLEFAAKITAPIQAWMEQETGIPYTLPKMGMLKRTIINFSPHCYSWQLRIKLKFSKRNVCIYLCVWVCACVL